MQTPIPIHAVHAYAGIAVCALLWSANKLAAAEDEWAVSELTADEVANVMQDPAWVLVDTRVPDAYNGWALNGIPRGGHLPGAVDFSARWLKSSHQEREEVLAAALRNKGIQPDKHIVLYSTVPRDRARVAAYLHDEGFRQLYFFDLNTWCADADRPLVRYKNFGLLLPPAIVKQLLDGMLPETFDDTTRLKFVEVSWGGEDVSYAKGHVPRSFHVNTDDFEPPPSWKLGSPKVLADFAADYGFRADDTVIISGIDPTASYRLAVVLQYMGVRDVRVLNGGFAVWKAAGYDIETSRREPPQAKSFGAKIPLRPRLILNEQQVKAALQRHTEFQLVDNRTWSEFIGETTGYKYHFHKGRIPGSVYGQADFKGPNSLTPYRNIDNTMRNAEEILNLWNKSGIDTEKQLCFLCGGGWRAAEVLIFARVMGLSHTSLYSDGWIGWSNDRTNPFETGAP